MSTTEASAAVVSSAPGARWRVLGLLSLAELLAMTLWFSASAVAPQLIDVWRLGAGGGAWLTMAVQLGFVTGAGLSAAFNLPDIFSVRKLFVVAALLGALVNVGVAVAPDATTALALRFLTGLLLAAVYPPAMKMVATWFRAERGLAIGVLVGALTVGSATPHLARAIAAFDWRAVVLASSACAVVAAGLVAFGYRDGPFAFPMARFSWGLVGRVARERGVRLANLGYLGHMWELYAMWAWVPFFLASSLLAAGARASEPVLAGLAGFAVIAAGGAGCVLAGYAADRVGRTRLTIWSLALSGACAAVIGLAYGGAPALVLGIGVVWGFAIVADSAQYSAMVTELAPQDAVGTALTLQTMLGFLLTMVTIRLVPVWEDMIGWQWAFAPLAIGPALGIVAMRRLQRSADAGRIAGGRG